MEAVVSQRHSDLSLAQAARAYGQVSGIANVSILESVRNGVSEAELQDCVAATVAFRETLIL